MRSLLSLIIVLSCCVANVAAQRYEARLLDKANNQPVEYANIGIIGSNIGANSDSAGNFSLVIGDGMQTNTMIVSMIGYEDYKVSVGDFVKSNNHTIYLKKSLNKLNELVVRPVKLTRDELGTNVTCNTGSKEGGVPFPYLIKKKKSDIVRDTLTEIGTLMKVKHKKTFIDSVQINIGKCTYENIFFRLNIYEELDGDFKNILREPIYIRLTKEQVGNVIKVNLTDKNIVVNNNFIVSIEKVKDLGVGELTICGKLFGPAMYTRVATKHDRFIKLPIVSMGIAAFVTFSEAIK